MSASAAISSVVSNVERSIPASVKAWSVGAKTVNGPVPCRVVTRSAFDRAATNEAWTPVPCAIVGISCKSAGGISTLSIT